MTHFALVDTSNEDQGWTESTDLNIKRHVVESQAESRAKFGERLIQKVNINVLSFCKRAF